MGEQFSSWWSGILERDAEYARGWQRDHDDAVGLPDYNPLLACVFCGKLLRDDICESARSKGGGHMLAYWHRPVDYMVVAAGLYCRGCVDRASDAWGLRLGDGHASQSTGKNAFQHMERRLRDNPLWEPLALRRLVMVYGELSRLPSDSER